MINNKTDLKKKDKNGDTPLMYALKNKCDINIVKLMINDKTNLNQKDYY